MWEFPVDDGLVIVRPDVRGLFLLNSTAQMIWSRFRCGESADGIASALSAHFCIQGSIIRPDVESTIHSWQHGLLAKSPPPVSFRPAVTFRAELRHIDCIVNGEPMRVLLERGDVWDEIAPRLEPVRSAAVEPVVTFAVGSFADRVHVLRDGTSIGSEEDSAAARAILLQAMACLTDPIAILHAGCCGGVLLAGQTHSGKSTLCAALMSRGIPYLCDDSAVLNQDFQVAPMPFPIMLREGSWPLLEPLIPGLKSAPGQTRWGTGARFLQPPAPNKPASVTSLIFVSHGENEGTQLMELGVLDSLLALQRSGFWVEHQPQSIARFLRWISNIQRYRLRFTDLESGMSAISKLFPGTGLMPPQP